MSLICCPTCLEPVDVRPSAREGRHPYFRPQPQRQHSTPRPKDYDSGFHRFVAHRRATQ